MAFSWVMLVVILLSTGIFLVSSLPQYHETNEEEKDTLFAFAVLEAVCVVFFTGEYVLRLLTAPTPARYLQRSSKVTPLPQVSHPDEAEDDPAANSHDAQAPLSPLPPPPPNTHFAPTPPESQAAIPRQSLLHSLLPMRHKMRWRPRARTASSRREERRILDTVVAAMPSVARG